MNPNHLSFYRNLFLLSVLTGLILLGASFLIPHKFLSPTLPFQLAFFIAVTILIFHILTRAAEKKFRKFLNTYMLITTVKLLFFLILIAGYVFLFRSDAIAFVISFFILYILFSFFEVIQLVSWSKKIRQ